MNFVMLSDLHLDIEIPKARKDNLVQTQFEKLKHVIRFAQEKKALILQAGDFFNRPRSWYFLPMVVEFLKGFGHNLPMICSVFGQHDTYYYSESTRSNTMLGVLEKMGLVTILGDVPLICDEKVHVYGCSFGQEIPKPTGPKNILVIHAPISQDKIPMSFVPAEQFSDLYEEFDIVLCGDIHQAFFVKKGKRVIINTGPMLRREATEYNMNHTPFFYHYDGKEFYHHTIPCQPGDVVLSRDQIEEAQDRLRLLEDFVSSINCVKMDYDVSFMDNLTTFLKENDIAREVQDLISEVISKKGER